jgi:hypothetical protein
MTLLQDFGFVSDSEARNLIRVVCRMMHGPNNEIFAFAPMHLHIVFEHLVGFKPHELLFMKTSAAVIPSAADADNIRVRVQDPELDGRLYQANCEKEKHVSLSQVFHGVDVIDCVIVEVDLKFFSLGIGNRRWMMEMHKSSVQTQLQPLVTAQPAASRSLVPQQVPKAPADSVVRPRLSSLSWFKNISINEAKAVGGLCIVAV